MAFTNYHSRYGYSWGWAIGAYRHRKATERAGYSHAPPNKRKDADGL